MIEYGDYVRLRSTMSLHTENKEGYPCLLQSSLGRPLFNYKIYGNCKQPSTPAPQAPRDVDCAGDLIINTSDPKYGKYKIPIVSSGKNIIPYPYTEANHTDNGIVWTVNADRSITAKGTATDFSLFYITLWNLSGTSNRLFVDGETYTITDAMLQATNIETGADVYYENTTFTVDMSKYKYHHMRIQIVKNTTVDRTYYPQLELSSCATAYESCTNVVTTNIYVNSPLMKVGDFTDCIDFKRRKVIHKTAKVQISKTLTWTQWQDSSIGSRIVIPTSPEKLYGNNITTLGYCNISTVKQDYSTDPTPNDRCGKLYGNPTDSTVFWHPDYTLMGLNGSENLETANASLRTWLSNISSMYFIYALKTPIEEDISLPIISTKKGLTHISSYSKTPPSNISLKYAIKS